MRILALLTLGALALAAPAAAAAQASPEPSGGLVLGLSMAGGVEAGLETGKAGLFEAELLAGWEFPASGAGLVIRPELAAILGMSPGSYAALRPGARVSLPETPLWLRGALDWSDARGKDSRWRWVLAGLGWETRMTASLGLSLEADTGIPLSGSAGVPIMLRVGVTYRP